MLSSFLSLHTQSTKLLMTTTPLLSRLSLVGSFSNKALQTHTRAEPATLRLHKSLHHMLLEELSFLFKSLYPAPTVYSLWTPAPYTFLSGVSLFHLIAFIIVINCLNGSFSHSNNSLLHIIFQESTSCPSTFNHSVT